MILHARFAAHADGALADGGALAWTAYDTQSTDPLYAVWGSGPSDVWAVGARGAIRHFVAGAQRWSIVDSPTRQALRSVWGSGPSDVWAVGDEGTVLHYDGAAWTLVNATFSAIKRPRLFGVWGSGPSDVWAVGEGTVVHFTGSSDGASGERP